MGMLDYIVHRKAETREAMRQRIISGDEPRWVSNSRRRAYIRQVIVSCPKWVTREELKLIQLRARQLSELSGAEHHVSHVYPLNHPRVCGLTVPWNLEPRLAVLNLKESNHLFLDLESQLELFA